jgi:hypothetical protein
MTYLKDEIAGHFSALDNFGGDPTNTFVNALRIDGRVKEGRGGDSMG